MKAWLIHLLGGFTQEDIPPPEVLRPVTPPGLIAVWQKDDWAYFTPAEISHLFGIPNPKRRPRGK